MILVRARQEYDRYLDLLDAYGVLSASDKKLYEEFQGKPDSFSTASTVDPAARRHAKITRFKYEKELKQKLEVGFGSACLKLWQPADLGYSISPKGPVSSLLTIQCYAPSILLN